MSSSASDPADPTASTARASGWNHAESTAVAVTAVGEDFEFVEPAAESGWSAQ